jgi:PilZ domain
MKRRKHKGKPKEDSNPANQVMIQGVTGPAASPVETQAEIEPSASPVEMQIEIEASATSIELQDEIESLAVSSEMQQETENSASPAAISPDTEKPAAASKPPVAADRRIHPRYAFSAAAEVVAAALGGHIKTRIRDLSQQGCYVDTDSPLPLGTATDVRITKGGKSFEARARVVSNQSGKGMGLMFTAVEPEQLEILDEWITESRETSWLAANRRRSQRVLMKLPVRVSGQTGTAPAFEEEAHTLAISAHGALIALGASVYRGQRLTLANLQTKAALECVVAHIDRFQGEQIQVGVEFMLPNPTFWHVAFPPKDWTPRHPEAKSRA